MGPISLTIEETVRRVLARAICAVALFTASMPAAAQSGDGPAALTHTTPSGVALTVTADGLSKVRAGGRTVAEGVWRMRAAQQLLGRSDGDQDDPAVGPVKNRRIAVNGEKAATVVHEHGGVTVTYGYAFDGPDLTITARVRNRREAREVPSVQFTGLRFDFGKKPGGVYDTWSREELRRRGASVFHPSRSTPVGGICATGEGFGLGAAPVRHGLAPVLVNLITNRGHERPRAQMDLQYIADQPVWAEGMRTFRLKLRFSTEPAWKHLLTPYKRTFAETFGGLRHDPDDRPVVHVTHPSSFRAAVGRNRAGFTDKERRFDKAENVRRFVSETLPLARQWGAQGVVFTGLAGFDRRGIGYRPDFRLLPPAVKRNLPALKAGFEQAGLRLGVSGQPNGWGVRKTWHTSEIIPLSADKRAQLTHMWKRRIRTWTERGAELFYFVRFGGSANDIRALRFYREKLGPGVNVIATRASDVMLLYANGLARLDYRKGEKRFAPRRDSTTWRAMRWLVPGAAVFAEPGRGAGEATTQRFLDAAAKRDMPPIISGRALRRMLGPDEDKDGNKNNSE